ncbi:aminoglycoside phosphotransferase [Brachybacterium ginsengisoli]|uniref:Aminoglycoside phosphotransferase n=1 Tax=Brachybacterium ginsengisoli TaxID=1331682 RepID=A0A291H034_9MICO|nr:phosphotransferase [Brachybacterium ginsengisoli]ATG55752.1 aminoglycoside phosphotransferase [Brachybacterium ginsengisoli]
MTHRLTWADLPTSVHRRLELLLGGPVTRLRSCSGGFSRSSAEIIEAASGRALFVKAVRKQDNPGAMQLNRSEAAALARIPSAAPVPALVDAFPNGDWFVLVTEVGRGAMPEEPWTAGDLSAVLAALDELQASATPCPVPDLPGVTDTLGEDMLGFDRIAADPPADLDPWIAAHLDALRAAARRGIDALDGDTLCHSDLRADNILLADDGRVSLVDWAWASRGSRTADALQLLSSIEDPDGALEVDRHVDELLVRHGRPLGEGTDVLAGILAFFADAARHPHVPAMPLLGEHRRRRRDALLTLVRRRWERTIAA